MRSYLSGSKQTFVGRFFEEVAHNILGGELCRDGDGDICIWRQRTTVEVKSSYVKSSYGFRLATEQIAEYERLAAFPFDRSWYMFFAYRNNQVKDTSGKRRNELAQHKSPVAVDKYLAEAVEWGLLVDLSVVSRWAAARPHSEKSILGHPGAKTVDLKCKELYRLTNGGLHQELTKLGFPPGEFGTLSGTVFCNVSPDLFSTYPVRFPLRVVLPSTEVRGVQRMLRRRGFPLEASAVRDVSGILAA